MEPYIIAPETQWSNTLKILPQFDAYRVAYKHVNDQPIHAFFVIPKQLPPGPRPLLVRFHGGGWTEGRGGRCIVETIVSPGLEKGNGSPLVAHGKCSFLELALKHGAVVLTPDYRLRPEHEMVDLIDDVRSFWKWVEQDAQEVLRQSIPGLELDVSNLLVGGESAGGYLTAQTALLDMTKLPIKVLFIQYPALDLATLLRVPEDTPHNPYSLVEEHLAALEPGEICTRAKFGSRMDLHRAMVHAGKFCDISGDKAWIDPMTSLEIAPRLPPVLLCHSRQDEAVSWKHSEAWAEKLQTLQPDVPIHLSWPTGYHVLDTGHKIYHVFDRDHNMETSWLKEPLEFVQKYWPALAIQ